MPSRTGGEHGVAGQWRERRAVGIYKCHGRQCARNADRKPGGRCGCPLVVQASRGQRRTLPACASLDEAKHALAKLRAERQGRPAPSTPGPLTVGELAALYFESRLHLKPARRADAQVFLCHVAPAFGDSSLRQMRADDVRRSETKLRDEGVFPTARSARLSGCFAACSRGRPITSARGSTIRRLRRTRRNGSAHRKARARTLVPDAVLAAQLESAGRTACTVAR
jgi:hypothetical protein